MIEEKYKNQSDTLIIKFNGWLSEGYEDTKTVLMDRESIVDEIINVTSPEKIGYLSLFLFSQFPNKPYQDSQHIFAS